MALQKIEVDYDVAMEIASHEAVIRQTYKDSVGVPTWSVGLTSATGHDVTRYWNEPQSMQKCMDIYVWALRNYAKGVLEAFEGVKLTRPQFAAALSFHWNTGSIKKASWVKSYKAGKVTLAREQFMEWKKPASIIGRRTKERDLFFDGKWSNNGTMTEYTKLTKNKTPVWSSAKKVNVETELHRAFDIVMQPQTLPMYPEKVPDAPTLTPSAVDKPDEKPYIPSGFWAWLKSLFT